MNVIVSGLFLEVGGVGGGGDGFRLLDCRRSTGGVDHVDRLYLVTLPLESFW